MQQMATCAANAYRSLSQIRFATRSGEQINFRRTKMRSIYAMVMVMLTMSISAIYPQPVPRMSWSDATQYCASMGMRLPTLDELKDAFAAGLTKSWQPTLWYWSSTEDDSRSDSAWILNANAGTSTDNLKQNAWYVHCYK